MGNPTLSFMLGDINFFCEPSFCSKLRTLTYKFSKKIVVGTLPLTFLLVLAEFCTTYNHTNRKGNDLFMASAVSIVTNIAKPVAEEMGLELWDVRFEKEGATWYLRVFLDSENSVTIDELETASRKIDKLLDEVDPIEQSYVLELSSPGLMRDLVKTEHFQKFMGFPVDIRFYKAIDGVKDFTGILTYADDEKVTVTLEAETENEDGTEMSFARKEAAFVRLHEELGI